MAMHKVLLFLLFLMASDQRQTLAFDDLSNQANSSIVNSSVSVELSTIEEMVTEGISDVKSKRYLPSEDDSNIKKSFIKFATRVWKGLRGYLMAKVPYRPFGSERLNDILRSSMHPQKTANILPFLKKIELKPKSSTKTVKDKIYSAEQAQIDLNGTPEKICRALRYRWKYQLVSDHYDARQPAVVSYVRKLSEAAVALYETMNKTDHTSFLWKKKQEDTPSSDMTTQFKNLCKLTLAYGTNGTEYYKKIVILSAVLDGVDFMMTKNRYNGENFYGDWWHWLIGVPESFINILLVVYDELSQTQRDLYVDVISLYVTNPLLTKHLDPNVNPGAYSCNLAKIILALGILGVKEDTIRLATNTVKNVLKPVTTGSGFYADGSFLQHHNIPYTGLHGRELLESITQILFITKDTKYELPSNDIKDFTDLIDRAFIPLIYDGEMVAMVCGKDISRAKSTKPGYGSTLVYDLFTISKCTSQDSRKKLQEAVKYWIRRNPSYYIENTRNFNDIFGLIELLDDETINGDELPFFGIKLFTSMDRFVQRTPDYLVGLSLYSNRVSAFDAGNHENKRGWHTSDGMVYLYNDDEVQFNSAYWPTVDPYRLPGTTVDTINLADELANSKAFSQENWVGGVFNNNQAVVGMSLNKKGIKNSGRLLPMNLKAKKSWFVVDGQIVALGAGITGKTKASIETIIDNRLLNDKLDYLLVTNNGVINNPVDVTLASFTKNKSLRATVPWILLEEKTNKASIGYYFPTTDVVHIINQQRRGSYSDINNRFKTPYTFMGKYSTLLFHHGKMPVNASYAYVILPGITRDGLKFYVKSNAVTILANTEHIQAVKLREDNYVGINIWKESGGEIAGVSSNKPASIMIQTHGNQDTYVISDPTQSNYTINIKIPDFTEIVKKSAGVDFNGENNTFVINSINGLTEQFTVRFIGDKQNQSPGFAHRYATVYKSELLFQEKETFKSLFLRNKIKSGLSDVNVAQNTML